MDTNLTFQQTMRGRVCPAPGRWGINVVTLDPAAPPSGALNVLDWIDIGSPQAETNLGTVFWSCCSSDLVSSFGSSATASFTTNPRLHRQAGRMEILQKTANDLGVLLVAFGSQPKACRQGGCALFHSPGPPGAQSARHLFRGTDVFPPASFRG